MTSGKPSEATRKIELEKFIERSHEALRHQSQGHPEPFLALWSHADDVTIVGDTLACSIELELYGKHTDGADQEMTLRATQVYRREGDEWKIIHRHGDVLTPIAAKW